MITFRESDHTYWDGERRIPGVTSILKPLYTADFKYVGSDVLERKSQIGKAVHKAIELHVLDGLDYSSLESPVTELFDGYLQFEADSGFRMEASEMRVYSKQYGYAGTLDLAGYLKTKLALIDAKTVSQLSPAVGLQMSAYLEAFNEERRAREERCASQRYALRLLPGEYRLVPYPITDHRAEFATFMGLLHVHNWCQANKKTMEIAA